jgi:hypothetical protein
MKARPRVEVGDVGGAHPFSWKKPADNTPISGLGGDRALAATTPVDAMMAFAAFNANRAVTAQIGLAHSVARMMLGQAAIVAEAGERSFAPGPIRAAMTSAADLQANYARSLARAAQALGRRFGHIAFAFPVAGPFR